MTNPDNQSQSTDYRFIDWVLSLPAEADNRFWEELSHFEENQKMPYITSVERIGEEKGRLLGIQIGEQRGIQIGEQKGEAAILTRLLQRRFGAVPDWVREKDRQGRASLLGRVEPSDIGRTVPGRHFLGQDMTPSTTLPL
ncbi:MAG: hypothetical protein HQL74_07925 [Magnetococcales bacterium]|nr:hypothetical protein [Magnetococcales bacterium]